MAEDETTAEHGDNDQPSGDGGATSVDRRSGSDSPALEGPGSSPHADRPKGGFFADLFAPVAGFGVTFGTMFTKVLTEEYPEKPRPTQSRYHGRHQLNRHPDGLEKCIGCELCAWACPADAIYVEGADNTEEARFSPGERYGRVYQINYLRCIFCGLCIEACPTRALTMTNDYEMADAERAPLIYEKHQLLAPMRDGMLPPPFPMAEGMEERNYYRGDVTTHTQAQQDHVTRREQAQAEQDEDSPQEVNR